MVARARSAKSAYPSVKSCLESAVSGRQSFHRPSRLFRWSFRTKYRHQEPQKNEVACGRTWIGFTKTKVRPEKIDRRFGFGSIFVLSTGAGAKSRGAGRGARRLSRAARAFTKVSLTIGFSRIILRRTFDVIMRWDGFCTMCEASSTLSVVEPPVRGDHVNIKITLL